MDLTSQPGPGPAPDDAPAPVESRQVPVPPEGGPAPAATPGAYPPGQYAPPYGQQPYVPPQQSYLPPQQPYAPPQQPYQQPQYPYGAPPSPAPRKGFNWPACCGITCLVLLILGGGVGYCAYRVLQPFWKMTLEASKLEKEVRAADLNTIKSSAEVVSAEKLAANPDAYAGKWIALEGVVASGQEVAGPWSSGSFGGGQTTNYELEHGVMVMDTSNTPAVSKAGEGMRAYGKFFAWGLSDMEKMPLFGRVFTEEMKKDPQFKDLTQFVFFVAKGVEAAGGAATKPGAGEAPPKSAAAGGWSK